MFIKTVYIKLEQKYLFESFLEIITDRLVTIQIMTTQMLYKKSKKMTSDSKLNIQKKKKTQSTRKKNYLKYRII